MTTRNERARELRKSLPNSKGGRGISQQAFGEEIGLSQGRITQIELAVTTDNGTISWYQRDELEKIERKWNVNLDWLETGKGEMFKDGVTPVPKTTLIVDHINPKSKAPHIHKHGEAVLDWGNPFLTVLVIKVDDKNEEKVLVVPDYAMASYSDNYQSLDFIRQLPEETVPEDLKNRGTIGKFHVYGDSMEPNFYHNDYVYCSFVEIRNYHDFRYKLRNGYIYVIVCKNRAPMLKRLFYQDGDEFIQCYSDNEEKHKPFPVHLSEVKQLWYFRRRYSGQAPRPKVAQDTIIKLERGLYETNLRVDKIEGDINTGFEEVRSNFNEIKNLLETRKE